MSKRGKSGNKNKKGIKGLLIALAILFAIGIIGSPDEGENTDITSHSVAQFDVSDGENADYSDVLSEEYNETDASSVGKPSTEKNHSTTNKQNEKPANSGDYKVKLSNIPSFSGKPYVVINNNIPGLSSADRTSKYFENYSPLDYLGRCTTVTACLGKETMPTEERGPIGSVKPTGWHTVKYDFVDGRYLYNRCHLIGFQLSGENANTRNLITGTRYMNVQGMLPFENMVADYIKETNNHVLYRVTPVFKGEELLARGVQIEAYSVEDGGDGISFNVYCYNNQPGVSIDYETGKSTLDNTYKEETTTKKQAPTTQKQEPTTKKSEPTTKRQQATTCVNTTQKAEVINSNEAGVYLPKNGKRYHSNPHCSGMNSTNKVSIAEAEALGYTPCGRCF